jgi:hypothetical protein
MTGVNGTEGEKGMTMRGWAERRHHLYGASKFTSEESVPHVPHA